MSIKLICGPMATISHPAFRILVEQFGGCDEYYNEMINAGSLLNAGPFERYYIDPTPVPEKVVWQLTGHDIEKMVPAARQLLELPGIGLDINMGCSAPDVYKTGAGIGWMTRPIEETRQMMSEVGKEVSFYNNEHPESQKRFSVKLRLGDEDFTDEGFYSFCDMLVENGAKLLTLHPRTKKEKYRGLPRYEYAELLARELPLVTVYVNGCIKDFNSASFALKKCPSVKGLMIAREAVKKPWVFAELKKRFSASTVPAHTVDREKILLDFKRIIY